MAEELLETVERLQSRLSENQEPRKLQKTLKRLADLPMTVDILVETGVGKTVNSFRKHDLVGDMAKSIVAKWKKLVPQSADRPTPTKDVRSHSLAADISRGHKRVREPSPEEFRHVEDEEEEQMEEEYEHHEQEEEEMEEEEEDQRPMSRYQHGYSPSPPQAYSPTAPGLMGQRLPQYQPTVYDSPQEEPAPSPPRKEPRHSKPHQDPARDHRDRPRDRHSAPGGSEQERRKQSSQSATSSRGVEGKRSGDREQTSSSSSSSTHRPDKHKNSHTSHDRKRTPHDSRKDKKGGSEGRSHVKREEAEPQEEEREEFEAPTMSFESFLTYDAPTPTKKKKKLLKPPPKPAAVAPPPVQPSKPSATNGARSSSKRSEPAAAPITPKPEKRRKVVDVVPTLPDIPLPAIQPNYRPLPSIEHTPVSPQRRKVPVSYEEEDAGFTGRRFNSKMVVYSGAKTSYLPKMMSLYEQCIRVLQNNIDSIDEVGGVPFEILEPVLERCTPEQLYRIEECNQHFMEETDELWMKHCQRDFKRESPQEYESWRELYLRLHDEREERLRMLTQNISSAHANRPKGRQVKMAYVNSVAKPPRDVRRRQEKFGTQGGASSSSANSASPAPVRIKPVMGYSSQSDDAGHPSYSNPPESSRPSVSGGGHSARDKPQVKKIAPMMAKTIKAFKNRFSRR